MFSRQKRLNLSKHLLISETIIQCTMVMIVKHIICLLETRLQSLSRL